MSVIDKAPGKVDVPPTPETDPTVLVQGTNYIQIIKTAASGGNDEESEKEFKNIKFCKFNVDQDTKNICDKLDIMSIPTLILFKDGKEIKRNIGFINKEELENFIGDINV